MNPEQRENERRSALIERECKEVAGKKNFTPLITLNLPPKDKCPSCGSKMPWHIGRQAFLCIQPGCQQ